MQINDKSLIMNNLNTYIKNVLGEDLIAHQLGKQILNRLPLYITTSYTIYQTSIAGNKVCLLSSKSGRNTFTPDQLAKQMRLVSQKTEFPIVFIFEKVESYNVNRFIKKKINFIVPGKIVYIPSLMMHLQKVPDKLRKETRFLTPVAQLILLYHLQRESLNEYTAKQLSEKFAQSYRTVCRAINSLADFDLISLRGGKEKQIRFNLRGESLWGNALQYLQNPVERIIYTDEISKSGIMRLSNINALSHYSMLNDSLILHHAVYKKETKELNVEYNNYFGDNIIEIWRYDPKLLSESNYIDCLSLFLLLKENQDERIQGELSQMIKEMKWLED